MGLSEVPEPFVPALGRDWLTKMYDPVVRLTTREHLFKRRLLDTADLRAARSLLDVGCGTGTLAIAAARAHPELNVTGVDADPRILRIARAKAASAQVDVTFAQASADRLPISDAAFDRVLSSLFFHHLGIAMKRRAAAEMLRVLTPDGELHVADWSVPTNVLMRALFVPVQILDGFENTNDNIRGALLAVFKDAGFEQPAKRGQLSTMFGTLAWYRAHKPGEAVH